MAAFRQLLLLAGRRVAMATTPAPPRAFSTTSTGGSHVPQSHRSALEREWQRYKRIEQRHMYVPSAVTVLVFIGVPIGILGYGPSKSVMREGKSY